MSEYRTKKAVALQYNRDQQYAPKVSAKGKGLVASTIIERAKKNNIPLLEDVTLVELLSDLNINETIPEELYQAVAEVFSFIYRIDQSIQADKKD
ncbi:EscU/YscU/HrcU family type III secretion system export apparatus switch protein [Virgibacillus alimentarius]|uniref:Flagellar biosynthesis protein n=1 Tax=Virgibacillus alimentarius TaxID=698769 RepID=A0ABS4S3V5_9BACI|nr:MULTISPECIES: EscU/YscU/HrcU family type III secretion system export apparatus switch protein [Virgibacillus]MBP2256182.1 flagellar biosynthesis protein [Virgibacillus alimentarius]HLR66129.1 EscU/YscU/HrcU family type III secretion system export apparatus switch protein [Virgibacillus sp.]